MNKFEDEYKLANEFCEELEKDPTPADLRKMKINSRILHGDLSKRDAEAVHRLVQSDLEIDERVERGEVRSELAERDMPMHTQEPIELVAGRIYTVIR